MSQSNAAAIKRRVNMNQPPPAPQSTRNPVPAQPVAAAPQQGLTLPQVIAFMDKRLINLETFMQETTSKTATTNSNNVEMGSMEDPAFVNVMDEFNHRFEVLAAELDSMKDIIIKLQSFTMEVNKSLMDERVHIFSEFGNNSVAEKKQVEVQPEEETIEEVLIEKIEPTEVEVLGGVTEPQ